MDPDRELQLLNIPNITSALTRLTWILTRRSHHDRKPRTLVIRRLDRDYRLSAHFFSLFLKIIELVDLNNSNPCRTTRVHSSAFKKVFQTDRFSSLLRLFASSF